MAKLSYNELRIGTIFTREGDADPYQVLEYAFVRMQQRKPVTQLKIKNLISGKVLSLTAHQNDSFEEAEIESMQAQFIYRRPASAHSPRSRNETGRQGGAAGDEYWFHETGNPKNRFALTEETVGQNGIFLKANIEVRAHRFNEKIIGIELPVKIDLKVVEAPPAVRGDTAQSGTKTATLETGAKVNVPLFVQEGDVVRVNTQTGEYVERVGK